MLSKIEKIERIGFEESWDLEVDCNLLDKGSDLNHIFYANGILTSNSHSVAYSYTTIYDAILKERFPGEFMASLLTIEEKADKQQKILEEAKNRGVKIILPKVKLSKASEWRFIPSTASLIMPFNAIDKIGDIEAKKIVESYNKTLKRGFFQTTSQMNISDSVLKKLKAVLAFDENKKIEICDLENLQPYFVNYNLRKILTFK